MKSWLFTIMRNTYYTRVRAATREAPGIVDCASLAPVSQPAEEWSMQSKEVHRAIQSLPKSQSEVLMLVGVLGVSYEETAVMCGCARWKVHQWPPEPRYRPCVTISASLRVLVGLCRTTQETGFAERLRLGLIQRAPTGTSRHLAPGHGLKHSHSLSRSLSVLQAGHIVAVVPIWRRHEAPVVDRRQERRTERANRPPQLPCWEQQKGYSKLIPKR
ncbi:hypothetical protein NKI72_30490 [Mesorhizobium sp. M0437]